MTAGYDRTIELYWIGMGSLCTVSKSFWRLWRRTDNKSFDLCTERFGYMHPCYYPNRVSRKFWRIWWPNFNWRTFWIHQMIDCFRSCPHVELTNNHIPIIPVKDFVFLTLRNRDIYAYEYVLKLYFKIYIKT